MRDYQARGIVLKKIPYKESSFIITLLTKELGKISVIARGSRKPKSPLYGTVDYLNELNCMLYKKDNTQIYTLKSAELINAFMYGISYEKSKYLFAAAEILDQIIFHKEDADKVYELTIEYISYQKKIEKNNIAVFWRFILRLFEYIGIKLFIKHCAICKNETSDLVAYSYYKRGFVCKNCYKPIMKENSYKISDKSKKLLSILYNIGNYINTITIDKATENEITTLFLRHLQLSFDKKFYLKSIAN